MKNLFSTFLALVFINLAGLAQSFEWVGNMGGSFYPVQSEGGLAVDAFGNSFITGHFAFGSVDIDPGPEEQLLTPIIGDAYVAKVGVDGNLVWAAQIMSNYLVWGVDVAATPEGGVVAVGHFIGTVDFFPGAGTHFVTAAGDVDIFVLKLSASGQFQWVRTFSTESDFSQPRCHSVTVDGVGNIAVSGRYNGSMDVQTVSGNVNLSSINNEYDYFLMHLAANGQVNWVKSIGSEQWEGGDTNARSDVAMAVDGSVFMIGELRGTINFNPTGPGGVVSASSDISIFIVRFNADGSLNWVKKIGGEETAGFTEMPTMGSVAVGPENKVYFASRLTGEAILSNEVTVGVPFFYKSFVAQFDFDGNAQWGRTSGADISGIATDAAGFLYCTGYTGNGENMDIGFSNTIASVSGNYAMPYLMRFEENGDFDNLLVYDAVNPNNAQFGFGVATGGGSIYTSGQLNTQTVFSASAPNGIGTPNNINSQTETYLVRHTSGIPGCVAASMPNIIYDGNPVVCVGQSITLNVSGSLNGNAVWNWTSGADCTGGFLGNESGITLTPTQTGTYSVNGILNGCEPGPCASLEVVVELCTDINAVEKADITMFYLHELSLLRINVSEVAWLSVYDMAGRQTLNTVRVHQYAEVNLQHLPPGVYVAVLNNDLGEKVVQRFVR